MKISWDESGLSAFGDAMEYIAEDSFAAAIGASSDIEAALLKAAKYSRAHPPDKYSSDGDPAFRAFELHSFRISYRIEPDELIVIRFRHSKQQLLRY